MNGLSLAMIVNNDADAVALILNDVLDLCDEMVVIDTGSSDDTVRVVEAIGGKYFHFTPNGDASALRNFASEQCSGEWVMFLEPYDRFLPGPKEAFRQLFEAVRVQDDLDVILLQYRSDYFSETWTSFQRSSYHQIVFRISPTLRWQGIVNPIPSIPLRYILFAEDSWVGSRMPPEKMFQQSLQALHDLEAMSKDELSGKELIALAQHLKRHGRILEADECFELATLMDLDLYEKYELYITMAACSKELGEIDQCLKSLSKAVALDSSRPEAFIQLGILHFEKGEWERAIPLLRAASMTIRPTRTLGSFDEAAFGWLPWDYLSVCASELGHYDEALDFTFRALPGNPERERLLANMRLILERKKANAS